MTDRPRSSERRSDVPGGVARECASRPEFPQFVRLQERVGTGNMAEMAEGDEEKHVTFKDVQAAPVSVVTSPEWSGSEHGGRRYTAFSQNIEYHKPWHTLTGRMHYYLDHDWMQAMGESLPTFRPPLDLHHLLGEAAPGTMSRDGRGQAEVAVRYLTPPTTSGQFTRSTSTTCTCSPLAEAARPCG